MSRSKEEYISEIAKDLYLKDIVVEEVINRFRDLLIEDIVNEGKVSLHSLFSVTTKHRKGYKTGIAEVKDGFFLIPKLSPTIKKLFNFKKDNATVTIDKDNWREIYSRIK